METKLVVTKRFRNNVLHVHQYLLKEFPFKTAHLFLSKIEQRIELILKHPTIGKPSSKKENIRSVLLSPYNLIFYRYSNNKVEILYLFDMRKNPGKKPY